MPRAAARISGLLHCAENRDQPWIIEINLETTRKALEIASIFADHALFAFDIMAADKSIEQTRKIYLWVERNQYKTFSKRDCFNALKGTFHRVDNMRGVLNILIEHNYFRESKDNTGGRPSIIFTVNPKITKEW